MSRPYFARPLVCAVWVVSLLAAARTGAAQQSTLTDLPEAPPTTIQYRLGPILINPSVSLPELGRDTNVFNETTNPKQDYVLKLNSELNFFAESGLLQFAGKTGSVFTYFKEYKSERSTAQQFRGRLIARLSRLRPWVGASSVGTNERVNPEIDARAKRVDSELAAGVNAEISPIATVGVWVQSLGVAYGQDIVFREVTLDRELNRRVETVTALLRIQATPLTLVTASGYLLREAFAFATVRDSRSSGGELEVNFAQDAVIRGKAAVGFRQFEPQDPGLSSYRGVTVRGGVSAPLLWHAIVGANVLRDVQYSFERESGYYVETSGDVIYTQRLLGPFDVQVRGARQHLDYGISHPESERYETLRSYHAGIGYNFERSRIGVNYEYAERVGATLSDRVFSRRRIFGSFAYEFWK